jgi:phosphatidylserine/phosphatidylglycerophosphate/cardiolipin synthase-like enzyme
MSAALFLAFSSSAFAFNIARLGSVFSGGEVAHAAQPVSVAVPSGAFAAAGRVEVAFSPNQGAEELVVRVIQSAKSDIKVMAYSFTSPRIVGALTRASKSGIKVTILADYKSNIVEGGSSKKGVAALSAASTAGAAVRTISVYPIHHDKVIIVDGKTVETGSFNYSMAAAQKNSENVLVNWDNPALAAAYLKHFEHNWVQGQDFKLSY